MRLAVTTTPADTMTTREDRWEVSFAVLRNYVDTHGHACVPFKLVVGGVNLGHWVATQRTSHLTGRLSEDRRSRLESLPGWAWRAREGRWHHGLTILKRYVDVHGHAEVPSTARLDGFRLGEWVHNQRCAFRRGQLRADRERALTALPGWSWAPFDDLWEGHFDKLVAYGTQSDSRRLPGSYGDDCPVRAWVEAQRRLHGQGRLSDDRRRRLQAVDGWTWTS